MSLLGSLLKKANPPTKAEADSLHFGEAAASVRNEALGQFTIETSLFVRGSKFSFIFLSPEN